MHLVQLQALRPLRGDYRLGRDGFLENIGVAPGDLFVTIPQNAQRLESLGAAMRPRRHYEAPTVQYETKAAEPIEELKPPLRSSQVPNGDLLFFEPVLRPSVSLASAGQVDPPPAATVQKRGRGRPRKQR